MIEKARSVGGADLAVPLSDDACCYLIATIANDLGLGRKFPAFPKRLPSFFGREPPSHLVLPGHDFSTIIEQLLEFDPNADTYFSCLAMLHKCRLKYARILERQPIPTMDQVGPRGLLQYGTMGARALAGFMLWRKSGAREMKGDPPSASRPPTRAAVLPTLPVQPRGRARAMTAADRREGPAGHLGVCSFGSSAHPAGSTPARRPKVSLSIRLGKPTSGRELASRGDGHRKHGSMYEVEEGEDEITDSGR